MSTNCRVGVNCEVVGRIPEFRQDRMTDPLLPIGDGHSELTVLQTRAFVP